MAYKNKLRDIDILKLLREGNSPTSLAKKLNVSVSAITRKCKKLSGLNPKDYIAASMAKEWDTGTTIEELSHKYNLQPTAIQNNIDKGVYLLQIMRWSNEEY